jgi:hypothetical protein
MVDLLSPTPQDEVVMGQLHVDDPRYLERIRNGAQKAHRQLGQGTDEVAVVIAVLGMGTEQRDYSGWKTVMRGADSEETRHYFAGQLDGVLSGESFVEQRQEIDWRDEVISDELTGEAKYVQYAKQFPDSAKYK